MPAPGRATDRRGTSRRVAARRDSLRLVADDVVACRACPRLVRWRERVARERRAAYRDEEYWGRPITGFGDPRARVVVVGLAPGAHGANRTGRVFTGDRSGDWLYRAMHGAGLASQPTSVGRGDGLRLRDAWVTSAVRCAPPANAPTPAERARCAPYLRRELALLGRARVIVCLGGFAWQAVCDELGLAPRPRFAHGAVVDAGRYVLVASYHPSQQNTFTGTLTRAMLASVFRRAVRLAGRRPAGTRPGSAVSAPRGRSRRPSSSAAARRR
ncbi:MAG: uracil-DNA glycosylase [Acidimicrobiia bacterium]